MAAKTKDVQCSIIKGSVHMRDVVKIDGKYDPVFVKISFTSYNI